MSWKSKVLGFCKKYGSTAHFAVSTVLGAVLPGGGAVVDLVAKAFACAEKNAQDEWELNLSKQVEASARDLERVAEVLDVLGTDFHVLLTQVAALEKVPEAAARLLTVTLTTDDRVQAALAKLTALAGRFDRLEDQNRRLLAGQGYATGMIEELLGLMRRLVGVADFLDDLKATGLTSGSPVLGQRLEAFQHAARSLAAGAAADEARTLAEAQPQSAAAQVLLAGAQVCGHRLDEAQRALTRAAYLRPQDADLADLQRRVTHATSHGDTPPPPTPAPPSPAGRVPHPGDTLDGWRLEALLGHGGWGQVFRATRGAQTRALKVMHANLSRDPVFVERFKSEILTLAGLRGHKHLVEIHGFGYATDVACWYFLMEFVEGVTLEQALARRGALPWPEARDLFAQVAEGLAAAHARGVVHRDVKPANVLVRPDGRPVLVDFGIAALIDRDRADHRAGGYTALFAAPEQLRGRPADLRSDVYSLAASLYYALTYDRPQHREPDQFEPEHVPEPARAALAQALHARPERRHADAAAFRAALHAVADTPLVPELVVCAQGGGQYRSLQRAVRTAAPGARVRVRPGRYSEPLVLDRPVEIVGDGPREAVILEGVGGPTVVLQADQAVLRNLTLRNLTVDAVQITRGEPLLEDCDISSGGAAAVVVEGRGTNPTLRRCTLRDSGRHGVWFTQGAAGTLEECVVRGNAYPGVNVTHRANPTLRRCRLEHNRQNGLQVMDHGLGVLEECVIAGNQYPGVAVKQGGNPTLRRCTVEGHHNLGLFILEGGAGVYEDCTVRGNGASGVHLSGSANPTFRRCTVQDNKEHGVWAADRATATLEECVVTGSGFPGVGVSTGANPTLVNCELRGNRQNGLHVLDGGAGLLTGCAIAGNAYPGVAVKTGGNPTLRACLIRDNASIGYFALENGLGTLEGCTVAGNGAAGVHAWQGSKPVLRQCTVEGNREHGVLATDGAAPALEQCVVRRNGSAGVAAKGGGGPTLRGCTVVGNAAAGVAVDDHCSAVVEECDLTGNAGGAWALGARASVRRRGNRE